MLIKSCLRRIFRAPTREKFPQLLVVDFRPETPFYSLPHSSSSTPINYLHDWLPYTRWFQIREPEKHHGIRPRYNLNNLT